MGKMAPEISPTTDVRPKAPEAADAQVGNVTDNGQLQQSLTTATDLTDKRNSDIVTATRTAALPSEFPTVDLDFTHMGAEARFDPKDAAKVPGDTGAKDKSVKLDDKGRVTEVTYPDGKSRQFGYDAKTGDLNRIVQPDGQVNILKDGKWVVDSAISIPGRPLADANLKNPKVNPDGTFTYEQNNGSKVAVAKDGATELTTKDGAVMKSGADGKVTEVRYPNGDTRTFTYGHDGNVKTYTENGKTYEVRELGEVYGPDGKFTGMKNPKIGRDGAFTVQDAEGGFATTYLDGRSSLAKKDGSFVNKDVEGRVTDIQYADGRTAKFGYDSRGRLNSVTDANGKTYEYKASFDALGIRFGSFQSKDGSTIDNVQVGADGTLRYTDAKGKIHTDYTTGNSTTTQKTQDELRDLARSMQRGNWSFTDNSAIRDAVKGLSDADRVALDAEYKKLYGTSLTDHMRSQRDNPNKRDNVDAILKDMTESQLRTQVLSTFSNPADIAKANQQLTEFKDRAAKQGLSNEQIAEAQRKAIEELKKPGVATDTLRGMERALADKAPTIESLNTKYGVKYDEVKLPDGTTQRNYYVPGEKGEKLPIIQTKGDDPKEIERQLKEWQDNKIKELERKYNVEFSRDGQKDNPLGKEVNLRSPRIDELKALEEGLQKSQPSTASPNGRPILVQFAVEPTSSASAYVFRRPDGQERILFEPLQREYKGLKGTILHEWAHNAQNNMERNNPAALNKWYADLGYRKVTVDGRDQWQLKDKDGNYWTQTPGQPWYGSWTRVDDQGRPLKADGTLAKDFKDPLAASRTNEQMRDNAAVKPGSDKDYFNKPWEGSAESLRWFRSNAEHRAWLYSVDPKNYQATKEFDQADIDSDPRYGKDEKGNSKFIRLPDGNVGPNTPENRKLVSDFEATLARPQTPHPVNPINPVNPNNQTPTRSGDRARQGNGGSNPGGRRRDEEDVRHLDHNSNCQCGSH